MTKVNSMRAKVRNECSLGMTLVEVMIAAALLVIAFGAVYAVARAAFVNTAFHDAEIAAQEEARRALQSMVTELREARVWSLGAQTLPNDMLTFQIPEDADGNGIPLNVSGYLESVGTVMYTRDLQDLNGDGLTTTQLVRLYQGGIGGGTAVTVLANDIMANEDVNWSGTLDPGEDTNGSGVLERGIWFDRTGSLLRITVDTQKTAGQGARVWASTIADVHARN